MVNLAATPDTWGISGPAFLAGYLGAAAALFVIALVLRALATRTGAPAGPTQAPTPAEVAFLHDGAPRAVYSSLAGLRAAQVVDVGSLNELTVTGPAPAGLSRLDHAVYDAARRHVQAARLAEDSGVRAATASLEDDVRRAGWLLEPSGRTMVRLGRWLLFGLLALGVARLIAGLANGKAVGNLVIVLIAVGVGWFVLRREPRLSAAGRRAIGTARSANAHLAPRQAPSWSTYGLTGAAMGVALYGTAALWAADPAFASAAGIHRMVGGGHNGGSTYVDGGGGGGGSDGGGGSCGGGGGGGCGGGGGGCGG